MSIFHYIAYCISVLVEVEVLDTECTVDGKLYTHIHIHAGQDLENSISPMTPLLFPIPSYNVPYIRIQYFVSSLSSSNLDLNSLHMFHN